MGIPLTSNQMITLLQIYRGTLDAEFKIGTFVRDIRSLLALKLITYDGEHAVTPLGAERVLEALG